MTATVLHLSSTLALLSNEELVTRAQAELMFRLHNQAGIVNSMLLDGDTDETNTDS